MSNPREKLERELENLDYGFCNPRKAKDAAEREEEIKKELRELDNDYDD